MIHVAFYGTTLPSMLRKSKHKCYEIKMQGESLEGEMKKAKEWKE